MKKQFIVVCVFFFLNFFSHGQNYTGKMKIAVKDYFTGQPLSVKSITVDFNSDKQTFMTDMEGSTTTGELPTINYTVTIYSVGYLPATLENIKIGEGKTSYITMAVIPDRTLTKKEKKSLKLR